MPQYNTSVLAVGVTNNFIIIGESYTTNSRNLHEFLLSSKVITCEIEENILYIPNIDNTIILSTPDKRLSTNKIRYLKEYLKNVDTLVFPEKIVHIKGNPLVECLSGILKDKIKYMRLPKSLKSIDSGFFKGLSNLESVHFHKDMILNEIPKNLFEDCVKLKNIHINSNTITKFLDSCFKNTAIEEIRSADTLQGDEYEKGIIVLEDNVDIEKEAFTSPNISKVYFPDIIDVYGENAVHNSNNQEIEIIKSPTHIEYYTYNQPEKILNYFMDNDIISNCSLPVDYTLKDSDYKDEITLDFTGMHTVFIESSISNTNNLPLLRLNIAYGCHIFYISGQGNLNLSVKDKIDRNIIVYIHIKNTNKSLPFVLNWVKYVKTNHSLTGEKVSYIMQRFIDKENILHNIDSFTRRLFCITNLVDILISDKIESIFSYFNNVIDYLNFVNIALLLDKPIKSMIKSDILIDKIVYTFIISYEYVKEICGALSDNLIEKIDDIIKDNINTNILEKISKLPVEERNEILERLI